MEWEISMEVLNSGIVGQLDVAFFIFYCFKSDGISIFANIKMGRTKVIITEDQSSKDKFEKLYLSYFSKMKHFAKEYVIADDDAENLVQDVFTELWERKELLDMPVNLLAYLFTSIKNKSLNYLRHKTVEHQTMTLMQEEYNLTLKMNLNALKEFDDMNLRRQY